MLRRYVNLADINMFFVIIGALMPHFFLKKKGWSKLHIPFAFALFHSETAAEQTTKGLEKGVPWGARNV
jgi:hypothetical protein